MAAADTQSLKFKERIGYGLGDTASNFFFQTFNIFLLYYYTDVYGLPAAAVGTLFFVSRLWDAINDPLMGMLADRTPQTRWGRYRPYLLWMSVPYGAMGYLMFAGPEFEDTGKLIYAWVSYTLMMMLYTAINVPYSALMGVMTPVSTERTILSSFRFVGAFGGGLLISMLVRPMAQYLGGDDEALGFQLTMACFAVLSIAMFWFTFWTTKERVSSPPHETVSIQNDLRIILTTRNWIVLAIAGVLTLSSVGLRGAVTVYYFKYYVGDVGTTFIWILDQTSFFLAMNSVALILGVCCTKFLTDRFEKKTMMVVLSLLSTIPGIALFFVPPDQYWSMLLLNCLGGFLAGPTAPIVWSMYGDVADFVEHRFKRRMTGLVFSSTMFAQKFGATIGASLSGWLLAYYGYVANQPQTDESLMGIRMLFTFFPAVLSCLNVIVLLFYNLSDTEVAEIEEALQARRSSSEEKQILGS